MPGEIFQARASTESVIHMLIVAMAVESGLPYNPPEREQPWPCFPLEGPQERTKDWAKEVACMSGWHGNRLAWPVL